MSSEAPVSSKIQACCGCLVPWVTVAPEAASASQDAIYASPNEVNFRCKAFAPAILAVEAQPGHFMAPVLDKATNVPHEEQN